MPTDREVHIYRYVTESTFDSYLWQTLEAKQKFISQVMTSRTPLRSCEDVDETALSFAEIKALCAGDPRIKERMELDVDVSRLRIMKADWQSKHFRLEDDVTRNIPADIEQNEALIAGFRTDMETLAAHPRPEDGFAGMKVLGRNYLEKDQAGEALLDAITGVSETEPVEIGNYRGFGISAQLALFGDHTTTFRGALTYSVELGDSPTGKEIRDAISLSVMNQPEAAKAAALIMYNHLSGRRTNAVFCGPSGCGKSEIWRCLSKEYPGMIRLMDFSRFAADGWNGSLHLRDIFDSIDPDSIRRHGLVVVLDEADKIVCEHAVGSGGTDHNMLLQNNLAIVL